MRFIIYLISALYIVAGAALLQFWLATLHPYTLASVPITIGLNLG